MTRPIHKIGITNGNIISKNQVEISGSGYTGDICLIVSAKINNQDISLPCVFGDVPNIGKCVINGKVIELLLVDKFNINDLNDGECIHIIGVSESSSKKPNINGYYNLSEISTSIIKISNGNTSLSASIPTISNTDQSFVQICDFIESDNTVKSFFNSPLSTSEPSIPSISIPNNINVLNFNSVIPPSMNSNRTRFENYYYSSSGALNPPIFSNIGLTSPSINASIKNTGDIIMLLDIASSGTVTKSTDNDIMIDLGTSDPQIWFPIFFIGYSDTYSGPISDRFKVKYTLTFGKSKLASGNNSVIHTSNDIKNITPPNNTFQSLEISDNSIINGKTWGFTIDATSYNNTFGMGSYLRPKFRTYDGFAINSAIEDDNNSGHIYLSTHAWNTKVIQVDPNDPNSSFISVVDFSSSAMKGDFIIDIEVQDTKLLSSYIMTINVNCK